MPIRNPPHAGGTVRHQCLEPLGLSATAASHLRVSPQSASELVHQSASAFANTAVRAANTPSPTPETWPGAQINHDLRQARRRIDKVERVEAA